MGSTYVGEFEQLVLLAILRLGDQAFALAILDELDARAGRAVSRGALYKTLERLEAKGLVAWAVEEGTPDRGGHPRRRFGVAPRGVAALQESRATLHRMWEGLDPIFGEGDR